MRHPGIHRLRLEPEVELFGEVVREVGDHILGREPLAHLGQFDHLGAALEDLQVGGHPPADARSLDLDHDLFAGVQHGVMHLRDRCRCERLLIEMLEQLRGLAAELCAQQLVHLLGVGGRYPVQQAAELAGQRLAEGTGAGGDDLAELDVGRAEIGEGLRDLLDDLLLQRPLAQEFGDDACPVRVTCQPVAPMRAASTGSGTRPGLLRRDSVTCSSSQCLKPWLPQKSCVLNAQGGVGGGRVRGRFWVGNSVPGGIR